MKVLSCGKNPCGRIADPGLRADAFHRPEAKSDDVLREPVTSSTFLRYVKAGRRSVKLYGAGVSVRIEKVKGNAIRQICAVGDVFAVPDAERAP